MSSRTSSSGSAAITKTEVTDEDPGALAKINAELQRDVDLISDKTGLKGWQVMVILAIAALVILGLIGKRLFLQSGWRPSAVK